MKAVKIWNIYVTKANHVNSKVSRGQRAISLTLNPITSTNSILSIRNVPKVSSDIQVSFQPFTENKGLPCRGRFLGPAEGYSWAAAGRKPRGEGGGAYWKPLANLPTCRPLEWRTQDQPCPAHSTPALPNGLACTLFPVPNKIYVSFTFLASEDNFCWAPNSLCNCASCNALCVKSSAAPYPSP